MRSPWLPACALVLASAGCEVEPPTLDDDFVPTVEDLSAGLLDLGDFGVDGDAVVGTDDIARQLTVSLNVRGLSPSGTYVVAFHGLDELGQGSVCPELAAADLDGDGELSLGELEAFSGAQVFLVGDVSADEAGALRERWDLPLTDDELEAVSPLERQVLVLFHGDREDPIPVGCFDLSTLPER